MIASDEPLPEPYRRVRVERSISAESKAAASDEFGRGQEQQRQAWGCPRTPTTPVLLDDHRDTPLTAGDSNSR